MIVADFADFCLVVYMLVDDCYRLLPARVKPRSSSDRCSESELLTMALVSECMGWDEERVALSRWQGHRDLFPHIPHRTRFNRRRRALTDALLLIRQRLLADLDYAHDRQCAIDSLPVPVIGFHLVPGARSAGAWRAAGADYGKVVTKKRTIFGYKLHLLVTLNGVIRDFVLAPASVNDHRIAPELLAAVAEAFVRVLNGFRQVIETVNDQLAGQFGIGRNHAHTFAGLCARLASKLTAHTLCVYINRPLGKADALQIKALAFPN